LSQKDWTLNSSCDPPWISKTPLYPFGVPPRRFGKFFRLHISRMQTALTLIRFHYVTLSPTRTHDCVFPSFREIDVARRHFSDFSPRFTPLSFSIFLTFSSSFPLALWKHKEQRRKCVSSFLATAEELRDRSEVSWKIIQTRFPWFREKKCKKLQKNCHVKITYQMSILKDGKRLESLKRKIFKCTFHFSNLFLELVLTYISK